MFLILKKKDIVFPIGNLKNMGKHKDEENEDDAHPLVGLEEKLSHTTKID